MNCFTPAALVPFSPALMSMRRLQVLDLSGNTMGAEGTAAFSSALPAIAGSLTHLNLLCCCMDVEVVATFLAPALAQAIGLVELSLSWSDFG